MGWKKNPDKDLKLKYNRVLETGMIIALSFLILAFKYFPDIKKIEPKAETAPELITVTDIVPTTFHKIPPPPKPPRPVEASSDEVPPDIEFGPNELIVNEQIAPPIPPHANIEEDEAPPFIPFAEEMPAPIGGIAAIQKRITYPDFARRAGIQGRVFVKAYVDENGVVKKVELVKGIDAGCDEAAMKAVRETSFIPGKQRSKPVAVVVTIPIYFKLH